MVETVTTVMNDVIAVGAIVATSAGIIGCLLLVINKFVQPLPGIKNVFQDNPQYEGAFVVGMIILVVMGLFGVEFLRGLVDNFMA